jgi:hypothetical protein
MDNTLKTLEEERNRLLLVEEELWRQRSRATWIKSGDQNTKFFHHFASYRRNRKHIWELKSEDDVIISGQENLITEAHRFFKSSYSDSGLTNYIDQAAITGHFPRLVSEEEVAQLSRACTKDEIWNVLKLSHGFLHPHPTLYEVHLYILHPCETQGEGLNAHIQDPQPFAIPTCCVSLNE